MLLSVEASCSDSGDPTYIFCLSFRESEKQIEEEKQQNPWLSRTIVQDMDMKLFLKKENQLMTLAATNLWGILGLKQKVRVKWCRL